MRVVNEKQKRVSKPKGISATSLREKKTTKYRGNECGRNFIMSVTLGIEWLHDHSINAALLYVKYAMYISPQVHIYFSYCTLPSATLGSECILP